VSAPPAGDVVSAMVILPIWGVGETRYDRGQMLVRARQAAEGSLIPGSESVKQRLFPPHARLSYCLRRWNAGHWRVPLAGNFRSVE